MTKERAKKLMPIILAYENGEEIQFSYNGVTWIDIDEPNFEDDCAEFRIKPEVSSKQDEWRVYKLNGKYSLTQNFLRMPAEYAGTKEECESWLKEQYRPFKDCDELIATWQKMMGYPAKANTMPLIWVKDKLTGQIFCISGYCTKENGVIVDNCRYGLDSAFNKLTFLDNSPFGVVE